MMPKCLLTRSSHRVRAFSLIEVVIACSLLAIFALAAVGGMQFSSRMARINSNALAAKNIAQGYLERMMIDSVDHLDAAHYPNIDFTSNPPVYIDEALNIRCQVTFNFKGSGTLTNASANNLTDNNILWNAGEWNGDTVFLVSGDGAGQMAQIDFNTPNTLHLVGSLAYPPSNGTQYLINNGITVEITTMWAYLGRQYTQTIESLIIKTQSGTGL